MITKIEFKIAPKFKILIDGERGTRPNVFEEWRDAFAFGKTFGQAFSVIMREFVVASWSPDEGFYAYVAPELILQNEIYRKQQKAMPKPSIPAPKMAIN